jgi:hypothetical protein
MDTFATLTASGGAGAVIGVLGSILNRGFSLLEHRERRQDRRLDMAHEKDRWGHEVRLHQLQSQLRREESERELALATQALRRAAEEGSWSGLRDSVAADQALVTDWRWVQAVRSLVRPALTLTLWLLFFALFLVSLGAGLPEQTAASVTVRFVDAVTFAATTALAWWFGDRAPGRR